MMESMQTSHEQNTDKLHTWKHLPSTVVRIFFSQTPPAQVFLYSISTTSSLRALLLACELLGAMALCTLFTKATGRARSRTAPSEDDDPEECKMSDVGELV